MIPYVRVGAPWLLLVSLLTAPAPGDAQAPTAPIATVIPDVVYGHKDGLALTFDVLQPPDPNGAAVLYMVSGGWVSRWVDPRTLADRSFVGLLASGFTVIAVRHGSAPRYKVPEAEADVRMALRHVRENAETWSIDPDRLGVFGGSAGGHLSLMLGLRADAEETDRDALMGGSSSGVAAVVAYYPPVDLRGLVGPSEGFPALDFAPELAPSISPILFVSPDDPPTLLIHGDADRLVPHGNSEVLHAALEEAGAESEMVIIPGGDHGFTRPEDRARAQALMVEWFTRNLIDLPGPELDTRQELTVSPSLPAEARQFDFRIGEWDPGPSGTIDDIGGGP